MASDWIKEAGVVVLTITSVLFQVLGQRGKATKDQLEKVNGELDQLWKRHKECEDARKADSHEIEMLKMTVLQLEAERISGIIVVKADGKIIEWDSGATAIFHWTRSEMLGKAVSSLIPPELVAAHSVAFDTAKTSGKMPDRKEPLKTVGMTRDGQRVDLYISLSGWSDGGEYKFTARVWRRY